MLELIIALILALRRDTEIDNYHNGPTKITALLPSETVSSRN